MEERFNYDEILLLLREGKRVTREAWTSIQMAVLISGDILAKAIDEHYGDPDNDSLLFMEDTIYLVTKDGRLVLWHVTSEDKNAEDYKII